MQSSVSDVVTKEASSHRDLQDPEPLRSDQIGMLREYTRERLANVTTGIPAVLWWVVAMCAEHRIHVHLILAGILSLFLGIG